MFKQYFTVEVSRTGLAVLEWIILPYHAVFGLIGTIQGLNYRAYNKGIWLFCTTLLLVMTIIIDARANNHGRRWLILIPLMNLSILCLFIGAYGMEYLHTTVAIIDLIMGSFIFFRARNRWKWKMIMGFVSAIILIPALMLAIFTFLVGSDGFTIREYPSPPNYLDFYVAEVYVADGGATGGETVVTVCDQLPLMPFGLMRYECAVYKTGWIDPDQLTLYWKDGGIIVFNGTEWNWRQDRLVDNVHGVLP